MQQRDTATANPFAVPGLSLTLDLHETWMAPIPGDHLMNCTALPCRSVSMLSPGVVQLALIVTGMFGAGLLDQGHPLWPPLSGSFPEVRQGIGRKGLPAKPDILQTLASARRTCPRLG
jgi:hypothetical protein